MTRRLKWNLITFSLALSLSFMAHIFARIAG